MLPGRSPAQVRSTSASASDRAEPRASSSRSRTPSGSSGVSKPASSSVAPTRIAAVLAGDEVVLAVLDDPAEQRPVAPEQDDLPLERRRRRRGRRGRRAGRPDQAPAATTTWPQGIDPVGRPDAVTRSPLRLEAEHGLVRDGGHAPRAAAAASRALRCRGLRIWARSGRK